MHDLFSNEVRDILLKRLDALMSLDFRNDPLYYDGADVDAACNTKCIRSIIENATDAGSDVLSSMNIVLYYLAAAGVLGTPHIENIIRSIAGILQKEFEEFKFNLYEERLKRLSNTKEGNC